MKARGFWTLNEVSDRELEGRLRELVLSGGRTDARIVAHLAEVDARRLHLLGGRSLFEYCLVCLGLSESEAYYRICAARAARAFPIVFELLERREIHLTTVALIGKQLTEENHRQLLDDVRGKTKRQVLEVLARRWPKVAASSQIRKLPVPRRAVAAGPSGTLEPLADDSYCLQLHVSGAINAKLELARDLMSHANAAGDLAVVVERALDVLIEKLQKRRFGQTIGSRRARATETDRNQHLGQPKSGSASGETSASRGESANREEVSTPRASAGLVGVTMEEASASGRAVATAESVARRRESTRQADAATCQPSNMQASATSAVLARRGGDTAPKRRRHISHEVRRQVLERDGLRCSYVSPHGQRCCERAFLQLDHQRPWAKGGNDSFENLRVLCGAHNRMLAERELGAAVVRRAIRKEGPNR